ncbi:MAG TPA: hypothetical protein P5150_03635 [Candidatus Ratteibacteria bacterium]|nr:hypothetical protein [Candidatus Ratteibacteria bacterium]
MDLEKFKNKKAYDVFQRLKYSETCPPWCCDDDTHIWYSSVKGWGLRCLAPQKKHGWKTITEEEAIEWIVKAYEEED